MQINNATQTALQGLQNSQRQLNEQANTIARGVERDPSPGDETTEALVKVKSASNTAHANARVLKTADEMLGNLLDIQA